MVEWEKLHNGLTQLYKDGMGPGHRSIKGARKGSENPMHRPEQQSTRTVAVHKKHCT